jgi:hypothetical protein
MPRTDLPGKQPDGSPNWVEWSDKWMSGVRFHVNAAVVHRSVMSDGQLVQESDNGNMDRMRLALWGQQITGWSFADHGVPIPKNNVAGPEVIWVTLDGPDFNALADATQDLLEEVTASPTRARPAKTS